MYQRDNSVKEYVTICFDDMKVVVNGVKLDYSDLKKFAENTGYACARMDICIYKSKLFIDNRFIQFNYTLDDEGIEKCIDSYVKLLFEKFIELKHDKMHKEFLDYSEYDGIVKAVDFWVEKLKSGGENLKNTNPSLDLAATMKGMLKKDIPIETINKFKVILGDYLVRELVKNNEYSVTLSTDYHPEGILYDLCEELGISEHNFPWKTSVNVQRYSITICE